MVSKNRRFYSKHFTILPLYMIFHSFFNFKFTILMVLQRWLTGKKTLNSTCIWQGFSSHSLHVVSPLPVTSVPRGITCCSGLWGLPDTHATHKLMKHVYRTTKIKLIKSQGTLLFWDKAIWKEINNFKIIKRMGFYNSNFITFHDNTHRNNCSVAIIKWLPNCNVSRYVSDMIVLTQDPLSRNYTLGI